MFNSDSTYIHFTFKKKKIIIKKDQSYFQDVAKKKKQG